MKAEAGRYVLDSFALLAYLENEAGADRVTALLGAAGRGGGLDVDRQLR
ncbi:MAG: hypothetical protein HZY76_00020 [Anaerolineae bacterium]|nr:MAG: hypothetical protein HZY76_00020 [Anaerolineae bacterium]